MAESLATFSEIASMRLEIEEQTHLLIALLRANPAIADELLEKLNADPILAEILVLIDGSRSQGDIQKMLASAGRPGSSKAGVSRKFDVLFQDLMLISPVKQTAGKVYKLSSVATSLKIVRRLGKGRAKASRASKKAE